MAITQFAREVVSGGPAALPRINTQLRLVVQPVVRPSTAAPTDEVLTRLEDVRVPVQRRRSGHAELVVSRPSLRGAGDDPAPGTSCLLRWPGDRGMHELTTSFVVRERIGETLLGWRLAVEGPVIRVQRRAHARVDLCTEVDVAVLEEADGYGRPAGVTAVRGYTVNVSEGGVLAVVEPPQPAVGRCVVVRLALGGETFVLAGEVLRHQLMPAPAQDCLAVAVRFDNPDEQGDRIRRHLFEHQLRARRLGVL